MTDSPAFIGAVSVIIGGIVGAAASLLTTWLRQRSEEKKHYRELLVSLALESWKEHRALARLRYEQTQGETIAFEPIDAYLIHSAKLADLILNRELENVEDIERSMSELHETTDAVQRLIYEHSARTRKNSSADST